MTAHSRVRVREVHKIYRSLEDGTVVVHRLNEY